MEKYDMIFGPANSLASVLKKYNNSLSVLLKKNWDSIKAGTKSAAKLVPTVIRKPRVILRWMLFSYRFYISLIILLILMNTLVPSVVDATLAELYPQIEKKIFGLFKHKSDDPRIVGQRKIILGLFWAGAFGLNAYILLLCLPSTVHKADLKARQNEARADHMVTLKPSESVLLYVTALKLTVNRDHESVLISKIDNLDNLIKSSNIDKPSSIYSEKSGSTETDTILLPKQNLANPSNPDCSIGPDRRYRIERTLGQGSMGAVFLARDQLLFRDVALKRLISGFNQDQKIVNRFRQEARALAQLSHPNIVQIYDFVQEGNQYWIAMEYVEGRDLHALIEDRGDYPLKDTLQMCILIAEAMDYAHNRGVVHRDFKPSNVLIIQNREPKIMDFGLAKLTNSAAATVEGSLLGSPAYISPEQARGESADARSDIYAMGATLYQLTTGRLPFGGEVKNVLRQKIAGYQPSFDLLKTRLPDDLTKIIIKMMASDPDERPATMRAVSQALKRISGKNA